MKTLSDSYIIKIMSNISIFIMKSKRQTVFYFQSKVFDLSLLSCDQENQVSTYPHHIYWEIVGEIMFPTEEPMKTKDKT